MRLNIRNQVSLFLACAGMAWACSGTSYRLKGEEIQPGIYQVYSASGFWPLPDSSVQWRTEGISRMTDFKAEMDSLISASKLVFIGSIDTVVGDGLLNASAPTGVKPSFKLYRRGPDDTAYGRFYARINIDTLIKGALPASRFWFEGYGYGSSCNVNLMEFMQGKFLNFSDDFTSMDDLKMPNFSDFCMNCPGAYWFNGQHLRSPNFPVLSLDIREVLPGFPVSLSGPKPRVQIPLRLHGRAYRPDGRVAPSGESGKSKRPAPFLRE